MFPERYWEAICTYDLQHWWHRARPCFTRKKGHIWMATGQRYTSTIHMYIYFDWCIYAMRCTLYTDKLVNTLTLCLVFFPSRFCPSRKESSFCVCKRFMMSGMEANSSRTCQPPPLKLTFPRTRCFSNTKVVHPNRPARDGRCNQKRTL